MKLRYHCKRQKIGESLWVNEPVIPVTFIGKEGIKLNFTAILDSGSDFVLIPKEVADALKLEYNTKDADSAREYAGEKFTTTNSKVRIRIEKGREKADIECLCAILISKDYQHEHIIFGSSFFEHFKIIFDFPKRKFEIRK